MVKKTGRKAADSKTRRASRTSSTRASAKTFGARDRQSEEPRWVKQLRKRKQPLELAISSVGWLLPASYDFNSSYEFGVVVHHPEGNLEFGRNRPTNRERYGADTAGFARLTYAKQKERLCEAFIDKYGEILTPLPWEKGQRGLAKWLAEPVDELDCDTELSPWLSEYMVGHPVFSALSPSVRKRLGISQGETGGPGSDGPVVTRVTCTMEDLNHALRRNGLPFVIVRDDRQARTASR